MGARCMVAGAMMADGCFCCLVTFQRVRKIRFRHKLLQVPEAEWKNVQWLSTLVLAALHRRLGVPGLVISRSLCAGALFLLAYGASRSALLPLLPVSKRFAAPSSLLPLAASSLLALAVRHRVQLRSELFVILAFAWAVSECCRLPVAPLTRVSDTHLSDTKPRDPGRTPPGPPSDGGGRPQDRGPAQRQVCAGGSGSSSTAPAGRAGGGGVLSRWEPSRTPAGQRPLLSVLLALNIAAANLHYGMIPFTLLASGALWMGQHGVSSIGAYPLAAVLAAVGVLAAPHPVYGWLAPFGCSLPVFVLLVLLFFSGTLAVNSLALSGLRFIWHHVFYFRDKLLSNPDHERLSFSMLLADPQRGTYVAWAAMMALGVIAVFVSTKEERPRGYKSPVVVTIAMAAWTLGGVERTRVMPFGALYALPLVTVALHKLTARLGPLSAGVRHARNRKPGPAARLPSLSSLLFASVAALCAALYAAPSWSHLGLGVAWSVWPVETVKFIKRHAGEIQPNIYHTNDFGGYMVYHLQEYKVWADTRETIFKGLESWYRHAYDKPPAFRLLVQHFGVNTILTKISKTRFVPGPNGTGFFWDVHADFTAPQEWALVAWDDFSVVFLKRHEEGDDGKLVPIPGHSSIIEHHEFRVLKPNLPHNNYPVFVKPTPKLTAAFEEDLRRCREHMPEDGVCRAATSAWKRRTGSDPEYSVLEALEEMRSIKPANLAVQMETRLLEMCVSHERLHRCDLDELPEAKAWVVSAMESR